VSRGGSRGGIQNIAFSRDAEVSVAEPAPGAAAARPGARPQYLRQRASLSHGGLRLEGASQGEDRWGVTFEEDGAGPGAVSAGVSKLDGGPASYGIAYDSAKSRFKVPEKYGIKRVAVSAASQESDQQDFDVTVDVEGESARHFSFTANNDSFVYDASVGVEVPAPFGVTGLYSVDAKRRAGGVGILPGWLRQSLGLQYRSEALGDTKVILHQRDPDLNETGLDYEAVYRGRLRAPGSPEYALRALRGRGGPSYAAALDLRGPGGLEGGVGVELPPGGGAPASGYGRLSALRGVAPGVAVRADARVKATSGGKAGEGALELEPIQVKGTADLSTLLPRLAAGGSEAVVSARYRPGDDRPVLRGAALLNTRPLGPVRLAAAGEMDGQGKAAGSLKVMSVGGQARYEAHVGDRGVKQIGEIVAPATLQRGRGQLYGRVTHSRQEHNGQPRLQLGMRYDVGLGSEAVRLAGESVAFDSGRDPVDAAPARSQRARDRARALRRQVEAPPGPGQQWIRK